MITNSNAALWWIWWGNPLLNIHSDQLLKLGKSEYKDIYIDYKEMEKLRNHLGLDLIPDDNICGNGKYGLVYLIDPEDLKASLNAIPAITFGVDVLKLSSSEWLNIFNISDKEHIRRLMQLSSSLDRSLNGTLEIISDRCGHPHSKDSLNFIERFMVVVCLYYKERFPKFFKRWSLMLSDKILNCAESIQNNCDLIDQEFYKLIDSELINLINYIQQKHSASELQFETLADFERIYQ